MPVERKGELNVDQEHKLTLETTFTLAMDLAECLQFYNQIPDL